MRRLAGVALALGVFVLGAAGARADNASVTVDESSYTPAQLHITAGTTVVWSYGGSNSHSVTADDGSFDSSPTCGQLIGGQCMGTSFSHQFNSPGVFSYHCKIVSGMTGSIVVNQTSPSTSASTSLSSTTTTSTTTPTSETSTSLSSDQPTITQAALPSLPSTRVLPKAIVRAGGTDDDVRGWVLLDVAIAGTTTIVGTILVRRGRVPFG